MTALRRSKRFLCAMLCTALRWEPVGQGCPVLPHPWFSGFSICLEAEGAHGVTPARPEAVSLKRAGCWVGDQPGSFTSVLRSASVAWQRKTDFVD